MGASEDRIGWYRLKRQIRGRGAFGEVHVMVGPARAKDEPRVIWAAEGDKYSIQMNTDPMDASAALDGALQGLVLAESLGAPIAEQVVRVTRVGIILADTEPSAVRAAATAAVVRAFGLEDKCQFIYEDGWRYEANPLASAMARNVITELEDNRQRAVDPC